MIAIAAAAPVLALIAQRESHPVAVMALMGTIAAILLLPVMLLLLIASRD